MSWLKHINESSRIPSYMLFELYWHKRYSFPSHQSSQREAFRLPVSTSHWTCTYRWSRHMGTCIRTWMLHNIFTLPNNPALSYAFTLQHLDHHCSATPCRPYHPHAQSATPPTPNFAPYAALSPTAPPPVKSSTGLCTKPSVAPSPPFPLDPLLTTNSPSTSLSPPPPRNSGTLRALLKPTRTTARRTKSPIQTSFWKPRILMRSINTAGSSRLLGAMC
jgi:hypothetical protein